MLLEEELIRIP